MSEEVYQRRANMASPRYIPSQSPSPPGDGRIRSPPPPEAPKESAVSRLFISPLTFISFLLSLAIIDTRNYNLRIYSHASPRPAPTSFLGRVKLFLHGLIYKPMPGSPYAYLRSSNEASTSLENTSGDGERDVWHWHTMQRKQMEMEVSDAFRVRKWVVLLLLAAGVGVLVVVSVGVRWVLRTLRRGGR